MHTASLHGAAKSLFKLVTMEKQKSWLFDAEILKEKHHRNRKTCQEMLAFKLGVPVSPELFTASTLDERLKKGGAFIYWGELINGVPTELPQAIGQKQGTKAALSKVRPMPFNLIYCWPKAGINDPIEVESVGDSRLCISHYCGSCASECYVWCCGGRVWRMPPFYSTLAISAPSMWLKSYWSMMTSISGYPRDNCRLESSWSAGGTPVMSRVENARTAFKFNKSIMTTMD